MSVTAALGFVASGMHAGIKPAKPDLALIATDDGRPVACAAVFTTNKFAAPPIDACRERLAASGPRRKKLCTGISRDIQQKLDVMFMHSVCRQ